MRQGAAWRGAWVEPLSAEQRTKIGTTKTSWWMETPEAFYDRAKMEHARMRLSKMASYVSPVDQSKTAYE